MVYHLRARFRAATSRPIETKTQGDTADALPVLLGMATDAWVTYTKTRKSPEEVASHRAFMALTEAKAKVEPKATYFWLGETQHAYAAVSSDGNVFSSPPTRWMPVAMWPEAPEIWNEIDSLNSMAKRYVASEARTYINLDLTRLQGELLSLMDQKKSPEDTLDELARIRLRLANARASFDMSGMTRATYRYLQGMVLGLVVLAPVTIVVANLVNPAIVWPDMVKSASACAIAGQFGAAVSVLTRISGGGLNLDYRVGHAMLVIVGFARPVLGAILASALYFAVIGGIVPLKPPADPFGAFAFFVAIGFLSGFSERYAQDMLLVRPSEQPKTDGKG